MSLKPGEIQVFTAPDSGEKLPCKKVPYMLIEELRKKILADLPVPEPPEEDVNYGTEDEPVWRKEANYADPDYLRRAEAHRRVFSETMGIKTNNFLMKRGVLPYLHLSDEQIEQVRVMREEMRADYGIELEEDDRLVWINYICLATPEDRTDLAEFLLRRNQATEQGIQEAVRKF